MSNSQIENSQELDKIKGDPAVLRVYAKYVKLAKNGNVLMGKCPFHADSSPSFAVHKDMLWFCHGGCGGGNIFQVVQRLDQVDFKEAVERVKKEIGHTGEWDAARAKVEKVFKPVAETKVYKTIPLSAWGKMEAALENSPEAVAWLRDVRGIQIETAKRLHIGFVQNIGNLAGAEGADVADKGWIGLPCVSGDLITSIKYRSIAAKRFSRQPGMATSLFNVDAVDMFAPVYLTEGEFDACVLEQAGYAAVSVPSAGVKLSAEHKDALMKASCVILAGDNDTPGAGYMDKLWRELGNGVYLLTWPSGVKDANDLFTKQCKGNLEQFKALVDDLTIKAKSQPMPSVYSLQEIMMSGDSSLASDHPDRMRAGWPSVDRMVNIMPGNVVGVNATSTGMGKSTWVLQWTLYNARKYGRTILNYQAEMNPSEIATMVASQVLRKDRNFLTGDDKKVAAKDLEGVLYYVGSDPLLNDINAVLDLLEAAIKRLSPYAVVLDHFHHLTAGIHNEAQVQSAAMSRIKQIAETYKVVFINVGQPRKASSQTKGKQIHISDAKGSGAWGDASNAVITLHRELNKSEDATTSKGVYEDKTLVKLLKGRSMGTGASATYLTAFGEFSSFEEIENNYQEEPE